MGEKIQEKEVSVEITRQMNQTKDAEVIDWRVTTNLVTISEMGLGWGVRHIQVACMCMCVTALIMVRGSMGVAVLAMTDMKRQSENITVYDWDKSTQSVILSSFFWGYMVMQIPAGILSKKFGGKPILLFAIIANGVISLLIPTLASLGGWKMVCLSRVAIGLTQACTYPASHTLLGQWLPDHERVFLSGIVYGGTQMGTILGMPISGLLAGTSLGWPMVFYTMAALMACCAILWYYLTASTPAQHRLINPREQMYIEKNLNTSQSEKPVRIPWAAIFKTRAVWALVVAHIGTSYGFVMFFVDMPTYLEKGLNLSLKNSATLSALPYIGMWVGSMVSAVVTELLFNKGILSVSGCRKLINSIGAVGLSVGLIALGFVGLDNTGLAVGLLVLGNTFSGFYLSGFMMNHLDLSPNFAGLLMSLTNFIANIGSVITPILTSTILRNEPKDLDRWRVVFLVTAGVSLATNFVYVLFGSSERQPWDNPNFLVKQDDPEEMKPVMKEEKTKEADASYQTST